MKTFSHHVAVGTTSPTRIFSFRPVDFHSVVIRNDRDHTGVLLLGAGGVSSTDGFDLAAGETMSFTYRDFDVLKLSPAELVELYGIATVEATTARVFGFRRS